MNTTQPAKPGASVGTPLPSSPQTPLEVHCLSRYVPSGKEPSSWLSFWVLAVENGSFLWKQCLEAKVRVPSSRAHCCWDITTPRPACEWCELGVHTCVCAHT